MNEFTHDFKIQCSDRTIEGQIEFDVDGKMSFQFNQPYQLNMGEHSAIISFLEAAHSIFQSDEKQDIILLRIKKKGTA